jgi:hypothetical protein
MVSNVFPNTSGLLPHVVVRFWTLVMDLNRYRDRQTEKIQSEREREREGDGTWD